MQLAYMAVQGCACTREHQLSTMQVSNCTMQVSNCVLAGPLSPAPCRLQGTSSGMAPGRMCRPTLRAWATACPPARASRTGCRRSPPARCAHLSVHSMCVCCPPLPWRFQIANHPKTSSLHAQHLHAAAASRARTRAHRLTARAQCVQDQKQYWAGGKPYVFQPVSSFAAAFEESKQGRANLAALDGPHDTKAKDSGLDPLARTK